MFGLQNAKGKPILIDNFTGVEDHPRPESYKGYMRSLSTMLSMMSSQSTGVPSGNHGLFHRYSSKFWRP